MDRREALKKMAVGGATIVGASAVLSNVAFADGGTTSSRPTGITGGTVNFTPALALVSGDKTSRRVTATLSLIPAGSCPFGSPATPRQEYAWSVLPGTELSPVISPTGFSTTLTTATVTRSTGNLTGTFTVRLTIRWVCDQAPSGATAAWKCRSFSLVIDTTTQGQDGTVSPDVSTLAAEDGSAVNCEDAPNPPLPSP